MFKQLFRLTVVTYVWKRYKAIIVSTIILFVFFWLVSQLHQDYLSYGNLNQDKQYIGLSFLIKWIAFVTAFIIYLVFNSWQGKRSSKTKDLPNDSVSSAKRVDENNDAAPNKSDPFEAIRQKDRLRSKADFIIEKRSD